MSEMTMQELRRKNTHWWVAIDHTHFQTAAICSYIMKAINAKATECEQSGYREGYCFGTRLAERMKRMGKAPANYIIPRMAERAESAGQRIAEEAEVPKEPERTTQHFSESFMEAVAGYMRTTAALAWVDGCADAQRLLWGDEANGWENL